MKPNSYKLILLVFSFFTMVSLIGCEGDNATNSIVHQVSGTWNITVRLDDGQQSSMMEFEWIFVQTGNEVEVKYTEFSGTYSNNLLILDGETGDGSMVHIEATVSGDVVLTDENGNIISEMALNGQVTIDNGESGSIEGYKISNSTELPISTIIERTINVDGIASDWNGLEPIVIDQQGDGGQYSGSDMTALYSAYDSEKLYVRLDLSDGVPSHRLYYGISFDDDGHQESGERFIFLQMNGPSCSVDEWGEDGGYHNSVPNGQGEVIVDEGIIELSVPIDVLNPADTCFFHAWNDTSGNRLDATSTILVTFE